jgi:hypothetical protein
VDAAMRWQDRRRGGRARAVELGELRDHRKPLLQEKVNDVELLVNVAQLHQVQRLVRLLRPRENGFQRR